MSSSDWGPTDKELAGLEFERSAAVEGLNYHHSLRRCHGEPCPIHNPSDHPLRDAPMQWRSDLGIIERRCPHDTGHPDPDDLAYKERMDPLMFDKMRLDVHGCDGCCTGTEL